MGYGMTFSIFLGLILVKFISIYYTTFDLFGDEAQYWIWSEKLDFGYYSKPPFLAWIIRLFTSLFGSGFVSLKFIPLVFYLLTSYVVYFLTLELYKNRSLALNASITFYLLPSVTISSFILSTDVILIFFWSLSLLMLLRIRANANLINFLLLGIFLGLSFLAKYAAVYFLLSLIVFLFFDKKLRNIFKKNIFYSLIFCFTCFVVFLPNIFWNINNGWITLNHTSDNVGLERVAFHPLNGAEFLLTQALMLGPILVLCFFFFIKKVKFNFQEKFLLSFSVPIFLIVLIESILVRANANWAAVGLIGLFIYFLNHVYCNSKKILFISNFFNLALCLAFLMLITISAPLSVFDRINGVSDFSNSLSKTHLLQKKYLVIEDRLLYSSIKYQLKESKKTILTPYSPGDEIKSHFHLSNPLPPLFKNDFIYIGDPTKLKYLKNKKKIIKKESAKVLFNGSPINIYEVIF